MKDLPDICLEIENSLPLWVGGDLEADAQRTVDEHLTRCARCRERGAKAREARAALLRGLDRGMEHAGAGADPWPKVRAGLEAEGLLGQGTRTAAPWPAFANARRTLQRWAVAAAVLVGVVFAWTQFAEAPETPAAQPPSVSGVPVRIQTAGLRPLAPTERRLRDSAQSFGIPDDVMPGLFSGGVESNVRSVGSPAGLEQAVGSPPK